MIALIDADVLLYRCGFAAQHDEYYAENRVSGQILGTWPKKSEAIKFLKEAKHVKKFVALRHKVIPEPISFACHSVKLQIQAILTTAEADSYCCYLSPKDRNIWRYDVAKTAPYKGNRTAQKPLHFDALRAYIEQYHPTKCVPGIEADDAMGIDQDKEPDFEGRHHSIICSIDKDMLMIPGRGYNFVTKEFWLVDETQPPKFTLADNHKHVWALGEAWFWCQMLLGDIADNIKGIKGAGPVAVYNIFKTCKTAGQLKRIVKDAYIKEFKENAIARFHENSELLWIQRKPGPYYPRWE